MRLTLLCLTLAATAASADTVVEQRDQLINKLKIQDSVLTTRSLGTGSVLELHGVFSETNIEELHLVIAYPFESGDAALDVNQVAAFALARSVETAAPAVRGGGMAAPGHVHFQFGPAKGDDLSTHLAKVFAALGASKVTAAHVDSAKAQFLKSLANASGERRRQATGIDLAAVTKAIDVWKRGYLRITLKGGKPAPDATAKLVVDSFKGWTLGPYVKPPAARRKTVVVRQPTTDRTSLDVRIELDPTNETEAAALLLLCQGRGTLRERVYDRKHQVYGGVTYDGSVVAVQMTVSPADKPDASLAVIREELKRLAREPISAKELTRLQEEAFSGPRAFEEDKRDPRSITLQHATSTSTIKAIAAINPKQMMAAAKKLATAPQAVLILERK